MVDCGCKKIQVKGDRRRSDKDQTEKKYGRHISSIFDSKGVGCAKYEGISVNPCNPLVVFGVESHKWCAMLACIFFLLYPLSFFQKKIQANGRLWVF